jgi:hypothetical protein
MVKIEITEVETPLLLGTDTQMIIQNVSANDVFWSVDTASADKFSLKKQDTIIVDYDIYLTSNGYGQEFVVVGRL